MKAYLKTARGVAPDLASRDLAIISHAHFIRNVFVGELLFRLSDERNFRDGINAVRVTGRIRYQLFTESAGRGDPPLFHGDRRQARKADNVADGKNVRLRGPIFAIYNDAPARVALHTRRLQIQLVDIALPA